MATYTELYSVKDDDSFRNKIRVASIIAAQTIFEELATVPNHDNRLIWARWAFKNIDLAARQLLWYVVAANSAATLSAILGATDAAIQSNVDASIDGVADGSQV